MMPESALSSFGKRFFAAVLDLLILSLVIGSLEYLDLAFPFLYMILPWLYFSAFESSSLQATPGKLALSLKVIGEDGERIGLAKAGQRFAGKFISCLSLGIGILMIAFNEQRQMLHDRIAGTLVRDRGYSPSKGNEREILFAARQNEGRLSPLLLASESSLSIDEAARLLEEMCVRGICRPEVTEDGRVEYHFPDFLPGGKS